MILSRFVWLPQECRGKLAFPHRFGPSRRHGAAAKSYFVPICLGTPEKAAVR